MNKRSDTLFIPISQPLKNRYFGIRHGESTANLNHFIASQFESQKGVGLTTNGIQQVRDSVSEKRALLGDNVVIISSDFDRTLETARIAAQTLGQAAADIIVDPLLRERDFGNMEGGPDTGYQLAWSRGIHSTADGVELIATVLSRTTQCILNLESRFNQRTLLLVSHSDPLMILESGFNRLPLETLTLAQGFKNAEIREFSCKTDIH